MSEKPANVGWAPEADRAELAKRLNKDFYLSFKYSQGSVTVQHLLFELISQYYHSTLPPEEFGWIAKNKAWLEQEFIDSRVPGTHIVHNKSDGAIEHEWEIRANWFTSEWYGIADREFDRDETLRGLLGYMIARDRHYQDEERKYQSSDPHESYLQTYALQAKPTGSAAYDVIYKDLAELIGSVSSVDPVTGDASVVLLSTKLQDLVPAWQTNHPGEVFTERVAA